MIRTMNLNRTIALFLLLAGCSGSTSTDTTPGSGGNGVTDGAAEGAADAGCVTAAEGAGCSASQIPCMPTGDPCCIGYMWTCDPTSGTWHKSGLGCACTVQDAAEETVTDATSDSKDGAPDGDAPVETSFDAGGPFACGSTTCPADQICTGRPPGIPVETSPPPIYYSCMDFPAACKSTPTCECVKTNINPGMCTVTDCSIDAEGNITLGCMGI